MYIIAGTPNGCTGIVFKDRAELDEVIKGLQHLKKDEIFLDRPLVYCNFPGSVDSDEMTGTYNRLLKMVEAEPWEK